MKPGKYVMKDFSRRIARHATTRDSMLSGLVYVPCMCDVCEFNRNTMRAIARSGAA